MASAEKESSEEEAFCECWCVLHYAATQTQLWAASKTLSPLSSLRFSVERPSLFLAISIYPPFWSTQNRITFPASVLCGSTVLRTVSYVLARISSTISPSHGVQSMQRGLCQELLFFFPTFFTTIRMYTVVDLR